MGARELLDRTIAAGFTHYAHGGELRVRQLSKLPDALRDELRAHKPELLALLRSQARAEAEKLAARAHRELDWGDADVRDFLDVSFAQHPHAALVALAELLDFVQRERQRAAGGLTRGA